MPAERTVTATPEQAAACLYAGHVMHHRYAPRVHRLRYRIFSLLVDLDRLDEVDGASRLFSRNRFNLYSFYDADHGSGSLPLAAAARERVRAAGVTHDVHRITLLCMPRVLGYVFNPLSVYYCYGAEGGLLALIYEVNNTFSQRHTYVIPVAEALQSKVGQTIEQYCAKQFHVSPFLGMDMRYRFRVQPPQAQMSLSIRVLTAPAEQPEIQEAQTSDDPRTMLDAVYAGRRLPLNNRSLARLFCTHPLLTLKVIVGIHWEALQLWIKGAGFRACPPAGPNATVVTQADVNLQATCAAQKPARTAVLAEHPRAFPPSPQPFQQVP